MSPWGHIVGTGCDDASNELEPTALTPTFITPESQIHNPQNP